jgi:hypothetical protein
MTEPDHTDFEWWEQTNAFFEMAVRSRKRRDSRRWLLFLAAYVRNLSVDVGESADKLEAEADLPMVVAVDPRPPSVIERAVDWGLSQLRTWGIALPQDQFSHFTFIQMMSRIHAIDQRAMVLGDVINPEEITDFNSTLKCELMREVYANPFASITFDPCWKTTTVTTLAKQIYDLHDWSLMPILADAVEEAGCELDVILQHLRRESPAHYRGCWVLDLLRQHVELHQSR